MRRGFGVGRRGVYAAQADEHMALVVVDFQLIAGMDLFDSVKIKRVFGGGADGLNVFRETTNQDRSQDNHRRDIQGQELPAAPSVGLRWLWRGSHRAHLSSDREYGKRCRAVLRGFPTDSR